MSEFNQRGFLKFLADLDSKHPELAAASRVAKTLLPHAEAEHQAYLEEKRQAALEAKRRASLKKPRVFFWDGSHGISIGIDSLELIDESRPLAFPPIGSTITPYPSYMRALRWINITSSDYDSFELRLFGRGEKLGLMLTLDAKVKYECHGYIDEFSVSDEMNRFVFRLKFSVCHPSALPPPSLS